MTRQIKPEPKASPILRGPLDDGPQGAGRRAPLTTSCAEAEALLSPTKQPGYEGQRAGLEPPRESAAEVLRDAGIEGITAAKIALTRANFSVDQHIRGVIDGEFADERADELLFAFWSALAGLALPGVGAMLGLSSDGISMILDTATLPAFEPAGDGGKRAVQAARALVAGYVDGLQEQLSAASRQLLGAGACFGHRDKSSLERKRLFVSSLFRREVMYEGTAQVNGEAIYRLLVERLRRLFDLSTVGLRSVRAGSRGITLDAKVADKMAERLLPGWQAKMQQYLPERWTFWMETRQGRIAPVAFQADLQALGRLVREAEFGVPATTTPEVRAR